MKNSTFNKNLNYSLNNIDNYKKELNADVNEVINKYLNVLVEYYKFILENIKIKKKHNSHFIIIRGLDTITNVFLLLLLYTKNIDVTYFHCQRSFYFYVEFVGQISEDEKMFLQLTSRDACTYVYKKTIFEINNEYKKINEEMTSFTKEKFELINVYVNLTKKYLLKIIEKNVVTKNEELIKVTEKILNTLNNKQIKISKLKLFENVTDNLLHNVENAVSFFEIMQHLVNKFVKNQNIIDDCQAKFMTDEFMNKLMNDPPDKLVNWLLS
jgi:hypothetical protein